MPIRVPRKRADSYQHGDLRAALIQAGLKLLTEGGVRGLTLRAAAQLAGVSHAAPYRHFRDKDALIQAVAEEGFHLLTLRMRQEIDGCGSTDVVARLRASAVGYVSYALEHPGYFRTIFGGGGRGEDCDPSTVSEALRAAGDQAYHVLRDLIAEGIGASRFRKGDPDQLALAAWSLVHGLSMLILDTNVGGLRDNAKAVNATTEALVGILETGLRAPGRR